MKKGSSSKRSEHQGWEEVEKEKAPKAGTSRLFQQVGEHIRCDMIVNLLL